MFTVYIDLEKCTCCGNCAVICPVDVFKFCPEGKIDPYDSGGCIGCMSCIEICPERCIEVMET
jgi:NAD-dependent dihydropyrimidine dehydrogenase PreA subunit